MNGLEKLILLSFSVLVFINFVGSKRLFWVPSRLQRPFVTLLNDISYPSWLTTHSITQQRQSLPTTYIPHNVPFAVGCGACYDRWSEDVSLNLTITNTEYTSVNIRSNNDVEINAKGHACRVQYLLTNPITRPGKVLCTLNIYGKTYTTEQSFYVKHGIDIQKTQTRVQQVGENDLMKCPDVPSKYIRKDRATYLFRVWHEDSTVSRKPEIVSNSMSIELPVKHIYDITKLASSRVSCSVYDSENPTIVWRSRYKISVDLSSSKAEFSYGAEEDLERINPKLRMPWIVIGIIASCAVAALILIVLGFHKCVFKRTKLQSKPIHIEKVKIQPRIHDNPNSFDNTLDICKDIPINDRPPAIVTYSPQLSELPQPYSHTQAIVHQPPRPPIRPKPSNIYCPTEEDIQPIYENSFKSPYSYHLNSDVDPDENYVSIQHTNYASLNTRKIRKPNSNVVFNTYRPRQTLEANNTLLSTNIQQPYLQSTNNSYQFNHEIDPENTENYLQQITPSNVFRKI